MARKNLSTFRVGGAINRQEKRLNPQTFTGEKYSGWRNWDTWEFNLLIDNDRQAYDRKNAFRENFKRKMKKGTFDREKAKYALRQYMGQEVRRLEKEYGGDNKVNFNNVDYDETLDHVLAE